MTNAMQIRWSHKTLLLLPLVLTTGTLLDHAHSSSPLDLSPSTGTDAQSTSGSTANQPLGPSPTQQQQQQQQRAEQEKFDVQQCHQQTDGFLNQTQQLSQLTQSPFFNCWRPYDQVFAFLDQLVDKFPDFIVKQSNVSSTYEGRAVPAYKIFNGRQKKTANKSLYIQGLIHAREWQAGSSVFYAMASFLDDLNGQEASVLKLLEEYELYFVPILNIDGYKYTWEVDRYWRKNRRTKAQNGTTLDGVDLNRNFGPSSHFNEERNFDPNSDEYPGDNAFSEPESAGILSFVRRLEGLSGIVDVHAFGPLVLRPYSNQDKEPEEPYGSSMKALGESVRDAMSQNGSNYTSERSLELYLSSGCFDDFVFMTFNSTIPAITIEVDGTDFVQPQSTIRKVGQDVYNGLKQFASEASLYHEKTGGSSQDQKPGSQEESSCARTVDLVLAHTLWLLVVASVVLALPQLRDV